MAALAKRKHPFTRANLVRILRIRGNKLRAALIQPSTAGTSLWETCRNKTYGPKARNIPAQGKPTPRYASRRSHDRECLSGKHAAIKPTSQRPEGPATLGRAHLASEMSTFAEASSHARATHLSTSNHSEVSLAARSRNCLRSLALRRARIARQLSM